VGRGALGWVGGATAATDGATGAAASGAGAGVPGTTTVHPVRISAAAQISIVR
jgi:hypothetical protein